MQFKGREEITEFDAQHFAAEGLFSQNSSEGHKARRARRSRPFDARQEFQDRLRAGHLRREGYSKAQVAEALGRSERFVAKWWQTPGREGKSYILYTIFCIRLYTV